VYDSPATKEFAVMPKSKALKPTAVNVLLSLLFELIGYNYTLVSETDHTVRIGRVDDSKPVTATASPTLKIVFAARMETAGMREF
jgi:hypothetical protein